MSSDSQLLEGNKIKIGKQIVLPLSKAVEIAFRGLKVRFWRSLITMSGVILAIAFLVSVWAGSAVLTGLWEGRIDDQRVKNMEVIVEVKEEKSTVTWTSADGQKRESEVVRQKVIRNTVTEILRRKGLDDPEESAGAGEKQAASESGEREGAAPASAGAAVSSGKKDAWLVVLSLCVAVVGIVNSMLMSVTERFREIGTMKCLGALDSFVIKLFFLESVFVGAIGTLIGVILGLLLTAFFSTLSYWTLRSLLFSALPWGDVLEGVLMAMVAGTVLSVLGAIYPAIVAARMEPVAAMRQEN